MWVGEVEGKVSVLYTMYRKDMASDYLTLETSASSWNSKRANLTQEILRALINTSALLPHGERDKVVEHICDRCRKSHYSWYQINKITLAGIKCYEGRSNRGTLEVRGLHKLYL